MAVKKCIICNTPTSFIFEGEGEYNGKYLCPKCQSEKVGTTFSGCFNKEACSIKIKRPNEN